MLKNIFRLFIEYLYKRWKLYKSASIYIIIKTIRKKIHTRTHVRTHARTHIHRFFQSGLFQIVWNWRSSIVNSNCIGSKLGVNNCPLLWLGLMKENLHKEDCQIHFWPTHFISFRKEAIWEFRPLVVWSARFDA